MLQQLTILYCIVFAVYKSNKAVISHETTDDTQWLGFWIIFGLLEFLEVIFPFCKDYFVVYMSKFVFVLYLLHQNGARILFDKFIKPNFHYVQDLVEDKQYQEDLMKTAKSKFEELKAGTLNLTKSVKKTSQTSESATIPIPQLTPKVENLVKEEMSLTPSFNKPTLEKFDNSIQEVQESAAPLLQEIPSEKVEEQMAQKDEESDQLFSNVVTHVENVQEVSIKQDVKEDSIQEEVKEVSVQKEESVKEPSVEEVKEPSVEKELFKEESAKQQESAQEQEEGWKSDSESESEASKVSGDEGLVKSPKKKVTRED